jgi:phage-related protein
VILLKTGDKELVWLRGEVKSPPFSAKSRREAGFLLRLVQQGVLLSMPQSRPMPQIGPRCHELRIRDPEKSVTWRIIYRIDPDAVIIGDIFAKKTPQTPDSVIDACHRRFNLYDAAN